MGEGDKYTMIRLPLFFTCFSCPSNLVVIPLFSLEKKGYINFVPNSVICPSVSPHEWTLVLLATLNFPNFPRSWSNDVFLVNASSLNRWS